MVFNALAIRIDPATGLAQSVERIRRIVDL